MTPTRGMTATSSQFSLIISLSTSGSLAISNIVSQRFRLQQGISSTPPSPSDLAKMYGAITLELTEHTCSPTCYAFITFSLRAPRFGGMLRLRWDRAASLGDECCLALVLMLFTTQNSSLVRRKYPLSSVTFGHQSN